MEGLAALSLTANLIQIINAAVNACSICREIYVLGSSVEDSRMQNTSQKLFQSYSLLKASLNANSLAGRQSSSSGTNLTKLAEHCCNAAADLQKELDLLQKPPGGGVHKTISKAWQKTKKAKRIEKLKRNLDEYQKALDSSIMIDVRQILASVEIQQSGQMGQLSQLSADLGRCHTQASLDMKADIDRAIAADEAQHLKSRDHIVATVNHFETSHFQQQDKQRQAQKLQQEHERFLGSLRFSDMNLRINEVMVSHPKTFQWIYETDPKQPWDNFVAWLKGPDKIYWISGKPGSGKSTLMKFLASDRRTIDMLGNGSLNVKPLVVTSFFWLSGNTMQRNLRGCLCSLLCQILSTGWHLFEDLVRTNESVLDKRSSSDWSERELQITLSAAITLFASPVCVFIDGLDECDQDYDIDNVLRLIETLSTYPNTKICVSSRPEKYLVKQLSEYCQLRLQDLTADDMLVCIRESLDDARLKCPPAFVDKERFDSIVNLIAEKADGVFLWVRYAIRSILQGMRHENDFKDLLDRIEQLPSEMNELYLQMWSRLNEDQQRYRDEATTYFSYEEFYPMSVFELMVALDPALQDEYIKDLKPRDVSHLIGRCEELATRLTTRCAGLLEITSPAGLDEESDTSPDETLSEAAAPARVSHKFSNVDATKSSWEVDGPIADKSSDMALKQLRAHHYNKIRFIHRTARDFLVNTAAGQRILGVPTDSSDLRIRNMTKAKLALLFQGLEKLTNRGIYALMLFLDEHPSSSELELLIAIKDACGRLLSASQVSYLNDSYDPAIRSHLWDRDFEGLTAYMGHGALIRHQIQDLSAYISPYYCGMLFLWAATGLQSASRRSTLERLALLRWLPSKGADIFTYHIQGSSDIDIHFLIRPATTFLLALIKTTRLATQELYDYAMGLELVDTLSTLLPTLLASSHECFVDVSQSFDGILIYASAIGDPMRDRLMVRMSMAKLCYLTMQCVEDYTPFRPGWTLPFLGENDISRVEFVCKPDIKSVLTFDDGEIVPFNAGSVRNDFRPSDADSVYLGQALDEFILRRSRLPSPPDHVSPVQTNLFPPELETLLVEVCERSMKCSRERWEYDAGVLVKGKRLLQSPLDPTEDVDESNWMERGYFRKPNTTSAERETDQSRDVLPEADKYIGSRARLYI